MATTFKLTDARPAQATMAPIESPYGYPELGGWTVKAQAGPDGVRVDLIEDVDPTNLGDMRILYLFASWADLAGQGDVRDLIRADVQATLAAEGLYDPAAALPQ